MKTHRNQTWCLSHSHRLTRNKVLFLIHGIPRPPRKWTNLRAICAQSAHLIWMI